MQDLRRKIYSKAKAEPTWKFWGLYCHIRKMAVLEEAYLQAKHNNGAPGIDRETFEDIEARGRIKFLEEIQMQLETKTYRPTNNRKVQIPKGNGKTRTLGIPTIKDRVVQGALKLILEPIFEADFKEGSYGYRPNKSPQDALLKVKQAILMAKPNILDVDIKAYFDSVKHNILFRQIAKRVNDKDIMHLLKMICKASGKQGIPQGGPLSPLLANIYLNPIDIMLEKAKQTTKVGPYVNVEYARFADDLVVLIGKQQERQWIIPAIKQRLEEELGKLGLGLNQDKTKIALMDYGESFSFLGFDFRKSKTMTGKTGVRTTPKKDALKKLKGKLIEVFQRYISRPTKQLITEINKILVGWVNYFRTGNSTKCFSSLKQWVERKIRKHMARARQWKGHGWKVWSSELIYSKLGLYNDYQIEYYQPTKARQTWKVT